MAQPATYNRQFSFTNFQTLNPVATLPADKIDLEYNALKTTLDQVLANLLLIQRDDGAVKNLSIGAEQLAAELTIGIGEPRVWTTATAYKISPRDFVFQGAAFYRCKIAHTSGVFATDLAAGKWELIVDFSSIPIQSASQVSVTPTGGISSINVQAALAELDSEKAASSHTHVATAISDSTTLGRTLMTAANAAAVLAALGISFPTSIGNGGTGQTTAAAAFDALKQVATDAATGVIEHATVAEFRAKTAGNLALTPVNVWDAAAEVTLTDAATVAVDMSAGFNFVVTLAGNRTLGDPTNTKNGQNGVIVVNQDATGGRTLAYGSTWKFAAGLAPTLSTAANAKDMLFYYVQSSTVIIVTGIIKAVA